jgi:hypothetical protein
VQSTVDDLEASAARFAKDQGVALKDRAVDAVKSAVQRDDRPAPADRGAAPTAGTAAGLGDLD